MIFLLNQVQGDFCFLLLASCPLLSCLQAGAGEGSKWQIIACQQAGHFINSIQF